MPSLPETRSASRLEHSASSNRSASSRKAVIEIQFSWIFIIIAGAVFLVLFLSIAKTQKNQTDTTINSELLQKLDSLILGSTSSFSSFKSISIPQVDLGITCDANELSSLSIGNGANIPTPVQAIYSRPLLNTNQLYIFTDSYETAYPVAPVLYLSAPTIRYIFINETDTHTGTHDNTMERLHSLFEENVTEITTIPGTAGLRETTDETIFISQAGIDRACAAPGFTGSKTSYIHIIPDALSSNADPSTGSGTVEFCKSPCRTGTTDCTTLAYYGDAMLKGAIISADPVSYACNTDKLLRRQAILAKLYNTRAELYIGSTNLTMDCNATYTHINQTMNVPPPDPLSALEFPTPLINPATHALIDENTASDTMQHISTTAGLLDDQNKALIRGTKCPLLY